MQNIEVIIVMYKIVKRIGDIIISFIGMIMWSPVFIILIIMIKTDSKGPILFKQKRIGIHKSQFNIFIGQMSFIGPRPALWNQYNLIEERDKYGANDVRPGLTGWAQINGRDELPIDVKAKFDGEYVRKMSFLFDCKCFFMTIFKVLKSDGVVEGLTNNTPAADESVRLDNNNIPEKPQVIVEVEEKQENVTICETYEKSENSGELIAK